MKERVFPLKIHLLPEKCQKQHLVKLLSEATKNIHQYPHDKLNRWLGFSRSIVDVMQLDTRNRPTSYIIAYDITKAVLKEAFLFEKNIVEKYSDERFENNTWPDSINKDNVFHLIDSIVNDDIIDIYPNEILQQYLGYIQGVLCIAEIINVNESTVENALYYIDNELMFSETEVYIKVLNHYIKYNLKKSALLDLIKDNIERNPQIHYNGDYYRLSNILYYSGQKRIAGKEMTTMRIFAGGKRYPMINISEIYEN